MLAFFSFYVGPRGVQGEFSPQLVNLHLIIHKTGTFVFAYNGDLEEEKTSAMQEKIKKTTCLCMHENEGNIDEHALLWVFRA